MLIVFAAIHLRVWFVCISYKIQEVKCICQTSLLTSPFPIHHHVSCLSKKLRILKIQFQFYSRTPKVRALKILSLDVNNTCGGINMCMCVKHRRLTKWYKVKKTSPTCLKNDQWGRNTRPWPMLGLYQHRIIIIITYSIIIYVIPKSTLNYFKNV